MKRLVSAALLFLAAAALFAQNKVNYMKQVELTVDRTDGVYAKGDTIRVYGKLVEEVNEALEMRILDGGKEVARQDVCLSSTPSLVFTGVYDEPKSLMFFVSVKGQKTPYSGVGAMVAPEEFRPGYKEPDDFVTYWEAQKKALRKSRMKVTRTRVYPKDLKDADKFEFYDIELSMPEGKPCRGYLCIPAGAQKKSLPLVLYVHSAGVNKPHNICQFKTGAVFSSYGGGAITLDINAHGMLNGQPQEYYDKLSEGELYKYSTKPLSTLDEFYFRQMYLREVRAMDFACSLPEWDGERALVYGESQGGGQSCAIAGLDDRITAAVINVPAMADYGGALQNRQSGWPSGYGRDAATDIGKSILPYCDGALFLQHTAAKIFMVVGMIDETCHPACVYAAFNACSSPDKQIHPFAYRTHTCVNGPFSKEWEKTVGAARTAFLNEYLK